MVNHADRKLLDNIKIDLCKGIAYISEDCLEIAYKININVGIEKNQYYLYGDKISVLLNVYSKNKLFKGDINSFSNGFEYVRNLSDYNIRNNITSFIGARMGKPEGAKLREMKPVIHSLFPVGHEVGNQRKIYDAIVKEAKIEIGIRNCNVCDSPTHRGVCCGENTEFVETKFKKRYSKNLG